METIILFPGLGASEKLFERFNFGRRNTQVINFLVPQKKESLHHYCERIAKTIPQDGDLIFIGVSFGGILAQEVSKIIPPKKLILISSIKTELEKPGYFTLLKIFPVYRILPSSWMKNLVAVLGDFFTPKTKEDREFFLSQLREADIHVVSWGIHQTIHWKQQAVLPGSIHIHGSGDRLFPSKKIKADYL